MLLPGENTLIIIHSSAERKVRLSYPVKPSDKPLGIKPAEFFSSASIGFQRGSECQRLPRPVLYMVQSGTVQATGPGEFFQSKDAKSETHCPFVPWNLQPLPPIKGPQTAAWSKAYGLSTGRCGSVGWVSSSAPKGVGSILGQGTCLGCRLNPRPGACKRQ